MQTKKTFEESANVLICALCAIVIVSLIGANVLSNSTKRLNASSNQVRAWKEALEAAEAGGEMAFTELRKQMSTDSTVRGSQWSGWTNSGTTHTSPQTTFGSSNLIAQTTVETFYFDSGGVFHSGTNPDPNQNNWYRVRSKGTSPLPNLKRAGMDDALLEDGQKHFAALGSTLMKDVTARGKGDSLLRKIDFQYDHFVSTYGPNGDGLNKALVAPLVAPSISRRIEQIVTPVTPFFDAAIKANGTFRGLGSAAYIDSYDSRNGPYDSTVKTNPSSPYYKDSRHGSVEIGSSTATVMGTIYGDLATNGGTVVNSQNVTGTVDNNVPFTLPDYNMPDTSGWSYQAPGSGAGKLPSSVTSNSQSLTPAAAGTSTAPNYYVISTLSGNLTVNPVNSTTDTYVAIRVNGSDSHGNGITGGIVVTPKVHLKIYFDYNINTKNNDLVNNNPTSTNPLAGNLQFYGISPPRDTNGNPVRTQTINLNSGTPAILAATFYAPSADVNENGNPDFIGTVVSKSFYANGNISWHYDRALNSEGELLDFRIASYVEDTR
jgi:hypothetical protein